MYKMFSTINSEDVCYSTPGVCLEKNSKYLEKKILFLKSCFIRCSLKELDDKINCLVSRAVAALK